MEKPCINKVILSYLICHVSSQELKYFSRSIGGGGWGALGLETLKKARQNRVKRYMQSVSGENKACCVTGKL